MGSPCKDPPSIFGPGLELRAAVDACPGQYGNHQVYVGTGLSLRLCLCVHVCLHVTDY